MLDGFQEIFNRYKFFAETFISMAQRVGASTFEPDGCEFESDLNQPKNFFMAFLKVIISFLQLNKSQNAIINFKHYLKKVLCDNIRNSYDALIRS